MVCSSVLLFELAKLRDPFGSGDSGLADGSKRSMDSGSTASSSKGLVPLELCSLSSMLAPGGIVLGPKGRNHSLLPNVTPLRVV